LSYLPADKAKNLIGIGIITVIVLSAIVNTLLKVGNLETMIYKEQFSEIANGLIVRAPAKINLSLVITGKRDDGFHGIETLMTKVNFYDEIFIEPAEKDGIELICTGPQWAPQNKDNLVYKAAEMLLGQCGIKPRIKLTLKKNIPAGTGLGSASSDGAATLTGIKKFLDLKITPEKIHEIASSLGSDVPFFLGGPLAFCTGKGEKIKKIGEKFDFSAILILSDINSSTAKVYDNYRHNAELYKQLSEKINVLMDKNRIDLIIKMCTNMLEKSCFDLHEELAKLKLRIESIGLKPLCLSGSGSVMYFFVGDEPRKIAEKYQLDIKKKTGCESIIVSSNRW